MGIIQAFQKFMTDNNKFPLALLFAVLPTIPLALLFTLIGASLNLAELGFSLVKDVIYWIVITLVIYILTFILKERGKFGFIGIANRLSTLFIAKFLMGISSIIFILAVSPNYFKYLGSVTRNTSLVKNMPDAIAGLQIAPDATVTIAFFGFMIFGFLIVLLAAYSIYRTISDFSEGTIKKNILVIVLFAIVMMIFNFITSDILGFF